MTPISTPLTLLVLISVTSAQQTEIIRTTLGPIQGLRKTVLGKEVDVYYGIPFAAPPVGELRFKRPKLAQQWTEVKATVTKPNACFQTIDTAFDRFQGVEMWNPNTPMSEDCLYLNVWVPKGSEPPRTTMVWIYGGGFYAGSSALDVYDGANLAASENVIVASMNYRLGPLGFLYTGTLDAPGNQGLLDQRLALKWIYNNIARFGGRQDSITIFGESAGAISVGFHLLSPLSMDYFTRAIMQSGSPFMDVFFSPRPKAKRRASSLASLFGCPTEPSSDMTRCLRNVSAQSITDKQWDLVTPGLFMDPPMTPVRDGYFLQKSPHELMNPGDVKDTKILIGNTKDEGTYFLLYAYPDLFPLKNLGVISNKRFKDLVHALNRNSSTAVDKAVMFEYNDSVVPFLRDSYRDIADDISGDRIFICPCTDFAEAFSSLGGQRHVYMYWYEHSLSSNPWPRWTGVMHGYEIEATLALPLQHYYTAAERDLVSRVTGYWTTFAETGSPNTDDSAVVWPRLTVSDLSYLRLRIQGDSVARGLRRRQCLLLSQVLPLLCDPAEL